MNRNGKAGWGCLIFLLICVLVAVGLSVHPISLRFIGNQFRHEDRVSPSDALYIPRFEEDRNGELYVDAFREYWAGSGRVIYMEDDKLFGVSILESVHRMARTRGIKEAVVKKMDIEGEGSLGVQKAKRRFAAMGYKSVVVLVPEYASRRFHILFGKTTGDGKTVFLIKPVTVSYYKRDRWWKDAQSRIILLGEMFRLGSVCVDQFKYGETKG